MTRFPPTSKPLTNTPYLTESPLTFEIKSGLDKSIRSAYDILTRISDKPEKDLPNNIVGELTLKLLAVQRSFVSGSGHINSLSARQDLWRLQSSLKQNRYAGLHDQAESFAVFVRMQDMSRIKELSQRLADSSSDITTPEMAEIQAIAQHSPSGPAQSLARSFLRPQTSSQTQSPTPRNSAEYSWQHTPFEPLQPAAARGATSLTRIEVEEITSPSPLPATRGIERSFIAPVETRKLKLIPELYSRLSVAELQLPYTLRVRKLECDHGATYYMSQTRSMGGFGKFRRGVNQDGVPVGLKEVRLKGDSKRGINPKTNRPYTYPTRLDDLAKEVALIRALGGRMKLLDLVTLDYKVYIVLTNMAGSLEDAMPHIPIRSIRGVSRSVTAQTARAMTDMHGKEHLHGDLKQSNIVLDHDGAVVVVDFGKGAEIDETGQSLETQMGTYPSPGMATATEVTAAADVWALAVMWIMSHNVNWGRWFQYNPSESYRIDQAMAIAKFYYSVLDRDTGKIDMTRIDPEDGAFGPMFSHLRAKDFKGTELAIEMLNPSEKNRMKMQEVATRWQALADEVPEVAQRSAETLKQAAALIADAKITQALQSVREWDLAHQKP